MKGKAIATLAAGVLIVSGCESMGSAMLGAAAGAGAVAVATNSTDEAGEELIEGLRRANFAASRGSDRRTEAILAGALVGALLGMLFGTDWEDAGEMQAASVSRESARGDQALARQLALVTGKRQEFQKQEELEGED